jgi:hypothetical protein
MDPRRRTALVAGICYLATFVSIPSLALYGAVRERGYVTGPGPDTAALVAGVLEMIVALACIATAVVLYPVVKGQNQGAALGFVAVRVLEAGAILAGVVAVLSIVTLRRAGAGADAVVASQALVAQYDLFFLFGQSYLPAVNALLLGSLLYRSRLVPRILPVLGLIGAPLLVVGTTGVLFDLWDRVSAVTLLGVLPIAVWELSLGVWLVVRGFRPGPGTTV